MTLNDLVNLAGSNSLPLLLIFLALPAIAFLLPKMHGNTITALSPWKYLYATIIYLVCFPGILAGILVFYTLFFTRANMMNLNLLVYFLPLTSMVITLIILKKNISFSHIPGFDRIYGLMVMIAITFIFILIIEKTRIWLFFGGSIFLLAGIVIFLFGLLKWGTYMLFRGRDEERKAPPSFPYK